MSHTKAVAAECNWTVVISQTASKTKDKRGKRKEPTKVNVHLLKLDPRKGLRTFRASCRVRVSSLELEEKVRKNGDSASKLATEKQIPEMAGNNHDRGRKGRCTVDPK